MVIVALGLLDTPSASIADLTLLKFGLWKGLEAFN